MYFRTIGDQSISTLPLKMRKSQSNSHSPYQRTCHFHRFELDLSPVASFQAESLEAHEDPSLADLCRRRGLKVPTNATKKSAELIVKNAS
jgi:hypothetical protein